MSSDTELSDNELSEEIDFTELEDAYAKVIETLDACLKGLRRLDKKRDRDFMIGSKTLEQVVRESIGPDFGSNVIKSLKKR
jgi:hypothetical protein